MSSINASVGSGIAYNSDNTATLNLGTGGVTAAAIDNGQNIVTSSNLTVSKNLTVGGNLLFSGTGATSIAGNLALNANLSVTGNIVSGGYQVPNLVQLYTYTLALG